MSESSEESEDPLYGEDSSLTEGESSDEFSSDELRRRILCSGSSSSTGVDSSLTSESYDEDESDTEVVKFSTGKAKNMSAVGFKATPQSISMFLKADPVLNGSDIFRRPLDAGQRQDASSKTLERTTATGPFSQWSTSDSSEDETVKKANSAQSNAPQLNTASEQLLKLPDRNDITAAYSVQETIFASNQLKAAQEALKNEESVKMEEAKIKRNARSNTSARKPGPFVKHTIVSSDDKGARKKSKPKSVDNLMLQGRASPRLRMPTSTGTRVSTEGDKNFLISTQARSSKKAIRRR